MKGWLDKLRVLYSGPAMGLIATLAILASFMWLWSWVGYNEDEFGVNVINAFSSLAIALAALWAGQGFKKRQEDAATPAERTLYTLDGFDHRTKEQLQRWSGTGWVTASFTDFVYSTRCPGNRFQVSGEKQGLEGRTQVRHG